jgi:hypothetical protein
MAQISGAQVGRSEGRLIHIDVLGPYSDRAAGAEIEFLIDGTPAGTVTVGSGSGPVVFEASDPNATVDVRVSLLLQAQTARLAPGQDHVRFVFESVPHFAAGVRGSAQCPDGTSGSPCVTCRSGKSTWRMCG